jgi:ATP-dependent Lon protease
MIRISYPLKVLLIATVISLLPVTLGVSPLDSKGNSLEAEEVCKKEMVEFGKIIFEKIKNHASRKDVKHIHKILAMFLSLERKVRVRLVNKENDDANEFFLVDKIKEAEALLLTNDNNDNDVEKVEKEKKKTLPPHILKAAKALLPKIQSLAKNKSEQRIKKILAILLDMEESQITLVCENEKVLAKRVKEAEGILNDDHWTKRDHRLISLLPL